jgi:hypothetical protein
MSGMTRALTGDGETTFDFRPDAQSAEERELTRIMTELSKRQLQNIDQLAPFQKELLELSMADLKRQSALSGALDSAITPADQAAMAKAEFERSKKLGPVQDQILEMQLANMRGELTSGQQQAVDAAIKAGFGDIDNATREGIGLISDELANARGLRLSDTPILREATKLSELGIKQKASLAGNLRANALFQMPGASSGIGLAQQQLAEQTKAFQAELSQRAATNRMSLFGQAQSGGIGLASVGSGAGASALSSLSGVRSQSRTGSTYDPGAYLSGMGRWLGGVGSVMQGAGSMAASDRRLKESVKRVGTLPSGIPIYRFKYLGTDEEHVGVMADEVLKVIPAAVSKDADGYYVVDYSKVQ